jgi:UDP-N-acetylglucosamine 2-epimerase (non-hydrolysing)
MKVLNIVGARPNFMKIAALMRQMKKYLQFEPLLVHTGQHYDDDMSEAFFKDLRLPEPDVYLGIGSGTHAEQTARIMMAFEKVCLREKPQLVVVVGDVNSTLACALVAAKLEIPVAHIEAGLRSFDRSMPEETNRLLTDQISDFLFTTCEDANINLLKEGISENKIFFVGNVMIDTLLEHKKLANDSNIIERFGLREDGVLKRYAVVTLHRPCNVDEFDALEGILDALVTLSESVPVIFPVHPRTYRQIEKFRLKDKISYVKNISDGRLIRLGFQPIATAPLGYLDFLSLLSNAAVVLTDSGGIQEETTVLQVPCLTLRENTERPITITEGTNTLVGRSRADIIEAAVDILENGITPKRCPKYWDGRASERIMGVLCKAFGFVQEFASEKF